MPSGSAQGLQRFAERLRDARRGMIFVKLRLTVGRACITTPACCLRRPAYTLTEAAAALEALLRSAEDDVLGALSKLDGRLRRLEADVQLLGKVRHPPAVHALQQQDCCNDWPLCGLPSRCRCGGVPRHNARNTSCRQWVAQHGHRSHSQHAPRSHCLLYRTVAAHHAACHMSCIAGSQQALTNWQSSMLICCR